MRRGFTLIEIMVVVAVIALVAAIAIPNLLRARHNSNEAAAIESVKTLSSMLESYRSAQTPPTYPAGLALLGSANPSYIPASLAGATSPRTARQGYYYNYSLVDSNRYTLEAIPLTPGTTGTRRFFVDETGVVRANDRGPAGPTSPELQ